MRILGASIALAVGLFAAATAFAEDCGNVSIAEMKWGSAGIAANIDKIILEAGYGCKVEIVPGDTMPTFTAMNETGQPDVASELWINAVRIEFDDAVKQGRLLQGAEILSEGAVEGWWIPKFIADANPDIRSVEDALKRPDLFPGPDGAPGTVYNCPPGWNCQISTANLFRALNADKNGFHLVDASSPQGLDDSIAAAFEKKVGWLGYYWAPTAILGKYDMTRLSFGVKHDKAAWDSCTSVPGCHRPEPNSYPVSRAFTVVSKSFAGRAGPAWDYLKKRAWDNSTINDVLAWQDDHHEKNRAAAVYFLHNYADLWTTWVPADVADKVKSSL
ncbi:ABC transporter substrate-binding protein [Rhizobium sp. Root708]|uniref:glycine betaine ABC transporter substrate-binding protein n=1 Tax=Rhizobium sp. Root708 TaxID=1736592 RepID=UPI0006FA0B3B|nr:glycine betaine ABC transporter substrate-binding protein [Rhizobium sp. Root708]KRB60341.1 ABC transporter substrate-binding protein [Rhizobium sp. Root708]